MKDIIYISTRIVSIIFAFLLCVTAIAYKMYWILGVMIVVGICGVIFLAYLKAKNILQ